MSDERVDEKGGEGQEVAVSVAFGLIAQLCDAAGQAPISGKLWRFDIDNQWRVVVNGTKLPVRSGYHGEESDGCILLEPYDCAVWWGEWPAGIIDPYGGFLVTGPAANEETFIAAMRKRLAETR